MADLRFTLIGEGPTDDALVPIIVWLLEHPSLALLPDADVASHFIDREQFTDLNDLGDVITATLYDFPSDLIFIHHDADSPTHVARSRDVRVAVSNAQQRTLGLPPMVPVVPVRETEAWLLIDETAIRQAARNPRGRGSLGLPPVHEIESCRDPKATLRQALRLASGLSRRRWNSIDGIRPRTVADLSGDFTPLRQLPAFQAFETDVRRVIAEQGWPERL